LENQSSELVDIYGKLSSTQGKATRRLLTFRNTTCEECLKEKALIGLWGRWNSEKTMIKVFQCSKVCYEVCLGQDKKESVSL